MRSGERLQEVLFARGEPSQTIGIDGIVAARLESPAINVVRDYLEALRLGTGREDRQLIQKVLDDAVPEFRSQYQS